MIVYLFNILYVYHTLWLCLLVIQCRDVLITELAMILADNMLFYHIGYWYIGYWYSLHRELV